MKQRIFISLLILALIGFVAVGVQSLRKNNIKIKLQTIEIKSNEVKLKELNSRYDEVLKTKADTEAEKQKQAEQIKQLESDKEALQRDLSAKLHKQAQEQEKLARAVKNASGVAVTSASAGCNTGNPYKDFIYYKESTCNTRAVNSIGCRGIAQACPGSKLPCGDDFACQDAWFTNYAITRYGSWEQAYYKWIAQGWW